MKVAQFWVKTNNYNYNDYKSYIYILPYLLFALIYRDLKLRLDTAEEIRVNTLARGHLGGTVASWWCLSCIKVLLF